MASPISIGSESQWSALLSGTSVVVADFYADWCGPCKMIAPTFESLSKEHSQPKKMAFAKVNTDNQSEIARSNGVSAMPTFMIFHNGACIETIKGANPSALTAAVVKAKALAGGAGAPGNVFKTPGRTLGGQGPGKGPALRRPSSFSIKGFLDGIIAFVGLYLVSFFSFNAVGTARDSQFNVHAARRPSGQSTAQLRNGGRAMPPRTGGGGGGVRTLADL